MICNVSLLLFKNIIIIINEYYNNASRAVSYSVAHSSSDDGDACRIYTQHSVPAGSRC